MEKIDLNKLFNKKENQINFMYNSILTFRLQTNSIMELFDTESLLGVSSEEEVFKKITSDLSSCYQSLIFLFNILHNDQEYQKAEFYKYYQKLLISKSYNMDVFKDYLNDICDKEYYKLTSLRKESLTDEDYLVLSKFQIKYALSSNYMQGVVGVGNSQYSKKVRKLHEDDPHFLDEFEQLMEHTAIRSQMQYKPNKEYK